MDSILTSIKKMLGPEDEDDTSFDTDIIIHINTVFSVLTQQGVGPSTGFSIKDKTSKWTDFMPDMSKVEMLKTYVYLKVKLVFDPPQSSTTAKSMEEQAKELGWRLYTECDAETEVTDNEQQ